MYEVIIQTTVPILLLIGAGLLSRRLVLRSGDERVFSAYVYYFALPALFFVNMANTRFTEETLRFLLAAISPIILALIAHVSAYAVFKFSRDTFFLLVLATIFGSLAFFGIPFITFAFPDDGESLATLAAASISIVSVTISITTLELYRLRQPKILEGLKTVAKKLSKNPLLIAIFSGVVLSLLGIQIPTYIEQPLHMLGGTTSTVAIFMLGVFLYGRKYENLGKALGLSTLRIVFLPIVAFFTTMPFDLPGLERPTLVLMHGMPIAISMIVLSERYDFHRDIIASLVLVSSLSAGLYLNIWLALLGHS